MEVRLAPLGRQNLNRSVFDRLDCGRGERLHLHEPLGRDHRLDDGPRALRPRQRHHVLLASAGEPTVAELDLDGLARLEAVQPFERTGVLVHRAVEVEDVDLLEAVALAGRKVVRVVGRRHLHDAGAELGVDQLRVEDDRNQAVDERMPHVLAVQMPVALIVRMDRHRGIAEHRLGARRRDHDFAVAVRERIREVEHRAFDVLLLLDLEVREHGLRLDVPVDQARVAVDQPLFVEPHEGFAHRPHHVRVHRELRPRPVAGSAHLAELLENPLPRLFLPLPDPFDELLAAEVVPRQAFLFELPLDHDLRRDPRMVDAGHPERVVALHPLVAAEHVLERRPAGVAHVERAGDVRRRDGEGVGLPSVARLFRSREEPRGLPELVPARLAFGGRVLLGHLVSRIAHPTDRVR